MLEHAAGQGTLHALPVAHLRLDSLLVYSPACERFTSQISIPAGSALQGGETCGGERWLPPVAPHHSLHTGVANCSECKCNSWPHQPSSSWDPQAGRKEEAPALGITASDNYTVVGLSMPLDPFWREFLAGSPCWRLRLAGASTPGQLRRPRDPQATLGSRSTFIHLTGPTYRLASQLGVLQCTRPQA